MRRLLLAGISFSNLDPSVTATWSATGAFEDSGTSVFLITGDVANRLWGVVTFRRRDGPGASAGPV